MDRVRDDDQRTEEDGDLATMIRRSLRRQAAEGVRLQDEIRALPAGDPRRAILADELRRVRYDGAETAACLKQIAGNA